MFIRIFFVFLCILFGITYAVQSLPGGLNFTNSVLGFAGGLSFGLVLIFSNMLLTCANLRMMNILLLGLFLGYLLGEGIVLVWSKLLILSGIVLHTEIANLLQTAMFLMGTYFGVILILEASTEWHASIPFIKLKTSSKVKDLLVDWTILTENRALDLASSGLLDEQLIVPKFVVRELHTMLDSSEELIRNKARRCLDILKKLEGMSHLELRYSDIDFPHTADAGIKLIQLARQIDANIITSDIRRFQQGNTEGLRIINIHMLSNVLKPITGEPLTIRIQRQGKEPRQGVGYLEDGTMVVVNGGAEHIGATIKGHVLSVKHTSSGRMIFCNVADSLEDSEMASLQSQVLRDLEVSPKSFYTIG